jgi:hypothetical protein
VSGGEGRERLGGGPEAGEPFDGGPEGGEPLAGGLEGGEPFDGGPEGGEPFDGGPEDSERLGGGPEHREPFGRELDDEDVGRGRVGDPLHFIKPGDDPRIDELLAKLRTMQRKREPLFVDARRDGWETTPSRGDAPSVSSRSASRGAPRWKGRVVVFAALAIVGPLVALALGVMVRRDGRARDDSQEPAQASASSVPAVVSSAAARAEGSAQAASSVGVSPAASASPAASVGPAPADAMGSGLAGAKEGAPSPKGGAAGDGSALLVTTANVSPGAAAKGSDAAPPKPASLRSTSAPGAPVAPAPAAPAPQAPSSPVMRDPAINN